MLKDICLPLNNKKQQHIILNDVKIEKKQGEEEQKKVQNYISIGNIIFIGEKEGLKYFPQRNIQTEISQPQVKKQTSNTKMPVKNKDPKKVENDIA